MENIYESCSLRNSNYKRIWIVGASYYSREMLGFIHDIQTHQETKIPVEGFLDDFLFTEEQQTLALLGEVGRNLRICPLADYVPKEGDVFINGIGKPENKAIALSALHAKGAHFICMLHPTVTMGFNNRIGLGCTFAPYSLCTTNITFGDFVSVYPYSRVSEDVTIGRFATLGNRSFIGARAIIGEKAWLWTGATVKNHTRVGENSVIGINSTLLWEANANCTYFGSPAVKIWVNSREILPGHDLSELLAKKTSSCSGTSNLNNIVHEIDTIVAKVISQVLGVPVCPTDNITSRTHGDWDSLKHVELIVTLEERFGISFEETYLPELTSQSVFVEHIKRLLDNA